MQGTTGKAAQVFQEIPGESVSDRRIRYWKWKRLQAKAEGKKVRYGRDLPDIRKTTISRLPAQLHALTRQVEAMKFELMKRGYTFPVGE